MGGAPRSRRDRARSRVDAAQVERGAALTADDLSAARACRDEWRAEADALFERFDVLALPAAQVSVARVGVSVFVSRDATEALMNTDEIARRPSPSTPRFATPPYPAALSPTRIIGGWKSSFPRLCLVCLCCVSPSASRRLGCRWVCSSSDAHEPMRTCSRSVIDTRPPWAGGAPPSRGVLSIASTRTDTER